MVFLVKIAQDTHSYLKLDGHSGKRLDLVLHRSTLASRTLRGIAEVQGPATVLGKESSLTFQSSGSQPGDQNTLSQGFPNSINADIYIMVSINKITIMM